MCLNYHPINFTVVAENVCDNKPAIFVLLPVNGTVIFVAPKSHNWSNITLMVENMYGVHELSHSFDELNRTGEISQFCIKMCMYIQCCLYIA